MSYPLAILTALMVTLAPASFAKPNLLLILADDLGFSDLGCYGSGIATPNLDRLAAEGLRLSNFHNTGRCCPSRAALMTGVYPHQAGVGHMLGQTDFPSYGKGIREDVATLPELLKKEGYHTFMSGKWHLGWEDTYSPDNRGFARFFGSRGYVDSYFTVVPRTDIYLDDKVILPAGEQATNPLHPDREFYTTDTYTDYAIHFIDQHLDHSPEQPFFGYLAYNAPHFPLHAKPEDTAKYRGRFREHGWAPLRQDRLKGLKRAGLLPEETRISKRDSPDWASLSDEVKDELDLKFALYCAIIDRLDRTIGRVLEHLESKGALDNTLVVFISDNGSTKETGMFGIGGHKVNPGNYEDWGRKGGWTSSLGQGWANVANTPYRRYKREVFRGGTASPAIFWAGEKVSARPAANTVSHQVAHIIDLLPTFVEVAGASAPDTEGESLVPVLRGDGIGSRTLFWEHEGNRAIQDGKWKLVASREEDWQLHDLSEDPSELHDLSEMAKDQRLELESKWQAWADRVGVRPWPEVAKSLAKHRKP
ncbi:arylsulfatase [Haloferula helveola]|uniref:Arylsulfatase n=1 Tax=Haloferula helveola TaxID=490095 RepID=A0ABN6H722_9BACT|nr:arylsulfatase [Haloferula helveola]